MALPTTRMEFRIALAHVDRDLRVEQAVIVGRHPSETAEHMTLRLLAWCLLYEERLEFGPGLSDPDASDLEAHDLTGRLTTWVECGAASLEKLKKVAQKNSGAKLHVVLSNERRQNELLAELAGAGRVKGMESVTLWMVDHALVSELAKKEDRRRRFAVTVVGDHFYVDEDGHSYDGAVEQRPFVGG